MGVWGGDVATPNLIPGGNSVQVLVTDYQGKRFEEGSGYKLVVELELQRVLKSRRRRDTLYRLPVGDMFSAQ